jgi:hypothetical protein
MFYWRKSAIYLVMINHLLKVIIIFYIQYVMIV